MFAQVEVAEYELGYVIGYKGQTIKSIQGDTHTKIYTPVCAFRACVHACVHACVRACVLCVHVLPLCSFACTVWLPCKHEQHDGPPLSVNQPHKKCYSWFVQTNRGNFLCRCLGDSVCVCV